MAPRTSVHCASRPSGIYAGLTKGSSYYAPLYRRSRVRRLVFLMIQCDIIGGALFYLSFSSPLFFLRLPLRPTRVRARQRDRATTEQRRGINNPEFPAGVPIIRFQGPPILAESYVRRRIYGLIPAPSSSDSLLFSPSSLPRFQRPPDPLLSPDASVSLSLAFSLSS